DRRGHVLPRGAGHVLARRQGPPAVLAVPLLPAEGGPRGHGAGDQLRAAGGRRGRRDRLGPRRVPAARPGRAQLTSRLRSRRSVFLLAAQATVGGPRRGRSAALGRSPVPARETNGGGDGPGVAPPTVRRSLVPGGRTTTGGGIRRDARSPRPPARTTTRGRRRRRSPTRA